jgi:hypothetical protein
MFNKCAIIFSELLLKISKKLKLQPSRNSEQIKFGSACCQPVSSSVVDCSGVTRVRSQQELLFQDPDIPRIAYSPSPLAADAE